MFNEKHIRSQRLQMYQKFITYTMRLNIFKNIFRLFFPDYCPLCDRIKVTPEPKVCIDCISKLPMSFAWDKLDSVLYKKIEGECVVLYCATLFDFEADSLSQKIIHEIKYNRRKDLGYEFGKYFGVKLFDTGRFSDIDYVIPLPLHPKREKKRGYNQSYWIAKGIAEELDSEMCLDSVVRMVDNPSQTTVERESRAENVKDIFDVIKPEKLHKKRVLIVDDVATTGSTLASMTNSINSSVGSCIVSIATLSSTK